MFDELKSRIINFITHRLFVMGLVALLLFLILLGRLFDLQIINGQNYLDNFNIMSEKTLTTNGQRGNIYDVNGNLLAYNKLTYSLTFTSSDDLDKMAERDHVSRNAEMNAVIAKMLKILSENGDSIMNTFEIKKNKKGEYVFRSDSDSAVNIFKRDAFGVQKLTPDMKDASAEQVFNFLCHGDKSLSGESSKMFDISDSYDEDIKLDICAVRYMVYLNRYNQYKPVTIAMDLSDRSVAAIKESSNELPGSDIKSDSVRMYNYSPYFSQIIGYTGAISDEEKNDLNKNLKKDDQYSGNEVVGKTGLEQEYEKVLRGHSGKRTVLVNNVGQIIQDNGDETKATIGNDLYLTIDAELQKQCYTILEKYLAGIILQHFQDTNQKVTKGTKNITTTEVYFALFDNGVIDLSHISGSGASSTEKAVNKKLRSAVKSKLSGIRTEIMKTRTDHKDLDDEYQKYLSYIYQMLLDNKVILNSRIDPNDAKYKDWENDSISLGEFLEYAVNQNWIDISKLSVSDNYYDTDEVMEALTGYIENELSDDDDFKKLVVRYLIDSGDITGDQVCTMLFDQGVLDRKKDKDYDAFSSGTMSAYQFMYNKIKKLEITPDKLGLDPCSGAIIVTDVNTGKVKALASYPSYDNNRLANNLDDDYYNKLLSDNTSPFLNRATQSSTAPGSTFKMVSAVAGLSEGVITPEEKLTCSGIYDKTTIPAKCWIYPSSHGKLSLVKAIEVSCNSYFYEVGYRLATKPDGTYDEDYGLKRLQKYATMFGLNKTSGIELDENKPKMSDQDAVRSAIGQGDSSYTPAELARYVTTVANSGNCYNLSILDKQTDASGNAVKTFKKSLDHRVKLSSTIWDTVHQGMYQVVHGEQHGEIFESLYTEVAGKTGTAEENEDRPAHALFLSYAPYDDPEISVSVVVPYGYTSSNAMEIARDVYKYYFSSDEKKAAAEEKDKKKASADADKKKSNNAEDEDSEDDETAVLPSSSNTRID